MLPSAGSPHSNRCRAEEPGCVGRGRGLVFVAEEAVDIEVACEQRPDPARPVLELALVVGRLPQPEVAEPGALLELVDPGDAALGEDPVPGVFPARMPKLEGVGELWIQRVEEQL